MDFQYISTGGISIVPEAVASYNNFGRPICYKFKIGDKVWIRCVKGKREIVSTHYNGDINIYTLSTGEVLSEDNVMTGSEYKQCELNRLIAAQEEAILNIQKLEDKVANCYCPS